MGDPLSTLASIVTLFNACAAVSIRTVTFIRSLQEAPEELLRLSNEISDLTTVSHHIEKEHVRINTAPSHPAHAGLLYGSTHLSQAKALISELDTFLNSLKKASKQQGKSEIDRFAWTRKRKIALVLERKLQSTKQAIGLHMTTDIVSSVRRMETALTTSSTSAEAEWRRVENKVDLIRGKITQYDGGPRLNTSCAALGSGSLGQAMNSRGSNAASGMSNPIDNGQRGLVAAIHLQEDFFSLCPEGCKCFCHLRSRTWRRSPPVLRSILGLLSLHYSGLALLKPACNLQSCTSFSSKSFKITYCLPHWLLMKAAHILMQNGPFGSPTVGLTLQRRTQEFAENSIYRLAERGDVSGIESLIRSGRACSTDAADSNGYTALHFTVRGDCGKVSSHTCAQRLQASKLLLRYGAKWELEDDRGVTAAQIAWEKMFQNEDGAEQFREVFPESQTLSMFDFSDVHKTVLALLPVDIEDVLLKCKWREQVNLQDAWGRTALHWAILTDDERSVRALITAGASIDIGDNEGNRPLHFAAGRSSIAFLKILLGAGARPRTRNANGAEPLHFACWQSWIHVQTLIQAGASVTIQDYRGSSAVEWACWSNRYVTGDLLIRAGANKNLADHLNGNPPLFSALTSQAYEFLEMLLSHDVDVLHINKTGSTVLHWTARCGDVGMLRILRARKSQFKELGIDQKDRLGRTAREVMECTTCTEEFQCEFVQFLSDLEILQKVGAGLTKGRAYPHRMSRAMVMPGGVRAVILIVFISALLLLRLLLPLWSRE